MEFVDTMQQSRVPNSSIVGVLSDMHGGRENIPFTTRDLENRKAANVRAENADDISKLLEFFKECKKENPKFYWDIKVDEEGIVKNVFLEPREFARRMLDVVVSRKDKESAETRGCEGVPIVKTPWPFAEQLSRVYTRAVFKVFEDSLHDSVYFRIELEGSDGIHWVISHTKRSEKHDWCQRQFKVIVDVDNGNFSCECLQWEHTGMFCPHLLRAFVHAQVEKIPHMYVLRRYTKQAKSDVNYDRRDRPMAGPDGVKESYRTKLLSYDAMQIVKLGRRSKVAFDRATAVLKGLRKQLEEIPPDSDVGVGNAVTSGKDAESVADTMRAGQSMSMSEHDCERVSRRPPPRSMTKGRASEPTEKVKLGARGDKKCTRGCGWCGLKVGHNSSTCPNNPANFKRIAEANNKGKRKRGRPRGSGVGGGRGRKAVRRNLIDEWAEGPVGGECSMRSEEGDDDCSVQSGGDTEDLSE
nr:uncharacterized protein LOC112939687 [Oryza sativa Japonica Group]